MRDISAEELKERMDLGEEITIIDVREPHEHDEFNIGGENLPIGEIMEWSEKLQMPSDREIVLYCRSGNRSGMAKSFLTSKGYSAVRHLTGGILAWQKM